MIKPSHMDPIADEVIGSLQIETPNGQTVARLTLAEISTIDADLAVFGDGSVMKAVDDHFAKLKACIIGPTDLDNPISLSRVFAPMGQLSLIQQSRFGVGQLDNRDDLFAIAARVVKAAGLISDSQPLVVCALFNLTVMDRKNRDYGSNNVSEYGAMGVLVRMRDKYHRAVRLQDTGGVSAVMDESLFDTWGDMSNYSHIGQAIALGIWKNN